MYKWILGLGFYFTTRTLGGGLFGFIIGSLIDRTTSKSGASNSSGGRKAGFQDAFEYYRQQSSRYDIQTMLMALSASVMKADGKVLKIELDFVKRFFASQFGNRFTSEHLQILKNFLDSDKIPLQEICADIRTRMPSEVRVQLIHYLFSIAKADGDVAPAEMNIIQKNCYNARCFCSRI